VSCCSLSRCCRLLCCRNVLAGLFHWQSSDCKRGSLPMAAKDFAVPGAQVFPLSRWCCRCGENSSRLLWRTCFGTVKMHKVNRMGCYAIATLCWVIVTTSAGPEWPVAEDCSLSPPALCHPCVSGSPSPILLPVCLRGKKHLVEETCSTGYLMQILLKCTDTYI